jgi:acyl carrier protein
MEHGGPTPLLLRLRQAGPRQRAAVLTAHLQEELQRVLELPEVPDANAGFFDLGIDSLKAGELNTSLVQQLGANVPLNITSLFDYPTVSRLAAHITDLLGASAPADPLPRSRSDAAGQSCHSLHDLTEAELDDLLAAHSRELSALGERKP